MAGDCILAMGGKNMSDLLFFALHRGVDVLFFII